MKMARPGKAVNHQALGSKTRPLERIEPQLAAEGGTPNPRKLRVDSIRIADATPNVAATKIGASAFAATTYSRDFAFRNSPRVRRATPGQFVMPMTNIRLRSPGGIKETMVTT